MVSLAMIWIACLVVATRATPCKETYHCSDCDRESGDCLTECDTGYYDRQCSSTCSKNCRNNKCVTSSYGSDNCTDGCVPGYQGIGCNILCDSPGGNCTVCPGGCDGGYCQLNSSCVSGCVDSYYGSDCGGKVGLHVGLATAAFGIMTVISLVVCCKYRHRLRRDSVTKTKDVVCDSVVEKGDAPVVELEWYSEIPLKDMAMQCGSSNGRGSAAGGGADDVYDVADVDKRKFAGDFGNIYSKLSHA
ncbi:multiple epidermal growth factor-like domains protein 6 isoform X1 [Haliotis rufescens]|uniref:multiple epidermal growth factor-like domains protein 6 isoform X1 n=1 Tax=Haliotis rufescens TaxID=6454 RepID=UPI00201F56F7|nr:multiple epidermal growth factor-like domains protein 6 isoform X1 [Haliotis rufescens]